jgi:RecA/RadA recombinase
VCLTTDGVFIHCLRDQIGVQFGSLADATFARNIAKIWRPVALNGGLTL